jgi:hypothetical protein
MLEALSNLQRFTLLYPDVRQNATFSPLLSGNLLATLEPVIDISNRFTTVALVLRHGGLSPFRKLSKRAKIKGARGGWSGELAEPQPPAPTPQA